MTDGMFMKWMIGTFVFILGTAALADRIHCRNGDLVQCKFNCDQGEFNCKVIGACPKTCSLEMNIRPAAKPSALIRAANIHQNYDEQIETSENYELTSCH
jgi:hypothetical protein